MLLNDCQVALTEVNVHCRAAAARYADAAEMARDARLSARFREFGEDRERYAARVEQEMRALDVLPREAETEIEDLRSLAAHVKAAISGDEAQVLVAMVGDAEHELAASVDDTLRCELPASARRVVEELRDSVERLRTDLAALKKPNAS